MNIKNFMNRMFKGKAQEHHQAPVAEVEVDGQVAENTTVYSNPKAQAQAKAKVKVPTTPEEKKSFVAQLKQELKDRMKSMSMRKLEKGIGMLSVTGKYLSPHDIRCMEIMGCDMEVLAAIHTGEIPDHAPNSDGPHPLSDEYKAMKAKEREEHAKKAIEALNEALTTTACAAAVTA